jgi:hypothetical protein
MLPVATLPCSLTDLVAVFLPCFTAPSFRTFIGLVVGLIGQTRRRTVCGMLIGAGLEQFWHHSRAPLLRRGPLVERRGGIGVDRPDRDPSSAGRIAADGRGRRHLVQAFR